MSLWGTTHDAATNKPKFAPDNEDSDYAREDICLLYTSPSPRD